MTHSEYPPYSARSVPLEYSSFTRWAEVEPVTEHSFLPSRAFGPVIEVSSARTSRSWCATKYGPAKATSSLRLSVIE